MSGPDLGLLQTLVDRGVQIHGQIQEELQLQLIVNVDLPPHRHLHHMTTVDPDHVRVAHPHIHHRAEVLRLRHQVAVVVDMKVDQAVQAEVLHRVAAVVVAAQEDDNQRTDYTQCVS